MYDDLALGFCGPSRFGKPILFRRSEPLMACRVGLLVTSNYYCTIWGIIAIIIFLERVCKVDYLELSFKLFSNQGFIVFILNFRKLEDLWLNKVWRIGKIIGLWKN